MGARLDVVLLEQLGQLAVGDVQQVRRIEACARAGCSALISLLCS
jgi:hypothetical protein